MHCGSLFSCPSLTAHPLMKAQSKCGGSFPSPRPALCLQPPRLLPTSQPWQRSALTLGSPSLVSFYPCEAAWSQEGNCLLRPLCSDPCSHPSLTIPGHREGGQLLPTPALWVLGGKRGGGGSRWGGEKGETKQKGPQMHAGRRRNDGERRKWARTCLAN